jgi:hypothetical protein
MTKKDPKIPRPKYKVGEYVVYRPEHSSFYEQNKIIFATCCPGENGGYTWFYQLDNVINKDGSRTSSETPTNLIAESEITDFS